MRPEDSGADEPQALVRGPTCQRAPAQLGARPTPATAQAQGSAVTCPTSGPRGKPGLFPVLLPGCESGSHDPALGSITLQEQLPELREAFIYLRGFMRKDVREDADKSTQGRDAPGSRGEAPSPTRQVLAHSKALSPSSRASWGLHFAD